MGGAVQYAGGLYINFGVCTLNLGGGCIGGDVQLLYRTHSLFCTLLSNKMKFEELHRPDFPMYFFPLRWGSGGGGGARREAGMETTFS